MLTPLLTLLLALAACSSDDDASTTNSELPPTTVERAAEPTTEPTAESAPADLQPLPVRQGPREETTHAVPHIQTSAELVPEVDTELRRRAYSLPGVEDRQSELSLPGARSLWLADDVELVRPHVLQSGREFAHIHPNGSLHVWLPVERAVEVAETKWGELHPWVGRDDFWDGLVMVYTPETLDEVDIVMQLIVDAYNHVTDQDLDPAAFP